MMNMNKVFSDLAEVLEKVESAYCAVNSVAGDTGGTSLWVALVRIDNNPLSCAFNVLINLIWESMLACTELCNGLRMGEHPI